MRVLVTGWAGYLGPRIIDGLHELGAHVTGLDLGWYLRDYTDEPSWPDVAHFVDLRSAFLPEPFDVVVHMAGLSNDPIGDLEPRLTEAINRDATIALIEQHPDAHHVVISSCSVYGTAEMATEDTSPAPLTAYARAKADVDAYLVASALHYASLRLGTVHGWSPGHRLDLVVNRMVRDAQTAGTVAAKGDAQRPLTHVDDVAEAVAFAVRTRLSGTYNVVGENVRVGALAALVADRCGVPVVTEPVALDARDYSASGARLTAAGFTPSRTVESSLDDLRWHTRRLAPGRLYERLPLAKRALRWEASPEWQQARTPDWARRSA